jgi:glycosyltransferase involved in cell wall biosynthesis
MDLSVVVPALNGRSRLGDCLDALAEHAPDAEVVVVNGPSTDGTGGLAREHAAVSRLLELPERNLNVGRNAGVRVATGDAIAFVGQGSAIEEGWSGAVTDALADADAVTGPVHRAVGGGVTTETPESKTIGDRTIDFFDGANVAFRRGVLETLDGFDEYLDTGGARDVAHRLAGAGIDVEWAPGMAVLRTDADDVPDRMATQPGASRWGYKYRSLAYRLVKNHGAGPRVLLRLARHAGREGLGVLRQVAAGESTPSSWAGNGRAVVTNAAVGAAAGLRARRASDPPARNPNGLSQHDA